MMTWDIFSQQETLGMYWIKMSIWHVNSGS